MSSGGQLLHTTEGVRPGCGEGLLRVPEHMRTGLGQGGSWRPWPLPAASPGLVLSRITVLEHGVQKRLASSRRLVLLPCVEAARGQ